MLVEGRAPAERGEVRRTAVLVEVLVVLALVRILLRAEEQHVLAETG